MAGSRGGLEREKKTLKAMLEIFCRENHETSAGSFCDDCEQLWEYARQKLDKCPFGPDKGPCSKCEIHCYKPDMRKRVQEVMRYSGPRMLKKHPVLAARHLLSEWRAKPKKKK